MMQVAEMPLFLCQAGVYPTLQIKRQFFVLVFGGRYLVIDGSLLFFKIKNVL